MNNKKEYTIRLANENDTRKISKLLEKYKNIDDISKSKENFFMDAKVNLNVYSKLSIRYYLYNFEQEFIIVEKGDEIWGLVVVALPVDKTKVFNLNVMILNDDAISLVKEIFRFAVSELNKKSVIKPTKIRTFISIDNTLSDFWINKLKNVGFVYEALRECETEDDKVLVSMVLDTIVQEEQVC